MLKDDKSIEKSVESILAELNLPEKVSLLSGTEYFNTRQIERYGIESLTFHDGPHALCVSEPTTRFPSGVAVGATWNRELIGGMAEVIGEEALAKGCDIVCGPCVNIVRHPLGGRNFESFSEDPFLTGELGVAYVLGLQSKGVGASLKHYACNNQELNRERSSSELDERTLREIYLPHFEKIVKQASPWTVMCAYNRINGLYGSENKHLLTEILREEWGFDGVVVSDWGANHSILDSITAGLDLEMPGPPKYYGKLLVEAVNNWQVDPAHIDTAARRMLHLLFRTGRIKAAKKVKAPGSINTIEHQNIARKVAEESIVLLKNDGRILPFDFTSMTSLAVIGPTAETVPTGGGSSKNRPLYCVSPLEAIRNLAGKNVKIEYEKGCDNYHDVPISDLGWLSSGEKDEKGWKVEYFNNTDFSGSPVCTIVKKKFHFWLFNTPPAEGINHDSYSARWTTTLTVPHTGSYRIEVTGNLSCRMRVIVDDELKGEFRPLDGGDALPVIPAELHLKAGVSTSIRVDYIKDSGAEAAYAKLCFIPIVPVGFEEGVGRAAELARRSDAAIVFVGLPEDLEGEMTDRPHMGLTGAQDELIRSIVSANPRTVVAINCGSPVNMPWIDQVPALLLAWYPGMEGGNSIANILSGKVNPSGRLPVTFPKKIEDTPAFTNYSSSRKVYYGEGIFVGYRHYDYRNVEPLFHFGFGLSYTTFEYSGLSVTKEVMRGGSAKVSLKVENTGTLAGAEVVQLYLRDVVASVPRPPKELKEFQKIFLKPGESKKVEFTIDERAMSFYDQARGGWIAEAGEFEVQIGRSSREIILSSIFKLNAKHKN